MNFRKYTLAEVENTLDNTRLKSINVALYEAG